MEIYHPGESVRFTYDLEGNRAKFTFLGIYLIYCETVEHYQASAAENVTEVTFERLVQQFTLKNWYYRPDGKLVISKEFEIPDREMGIRNPYMERRGARIKSTSWLIRVVIDSKKGIYSNLDYPLLVQGEPSVQEQGITVLSDLHDVYIVGMAPGKSVWVTPITTAAFPYLPNRINCYDAMPCVVRECVTYAEAEQLKLALEAMGAVVGIRPASRGYGIPEAELYEADVCCESVSSGLEPVKSFHGERVKHGIYWILGGLIIDAIVALIIWPITITPPQWESMGIPYFFLIAIAGLIMVVKGAEELLWVLELKQIKTHVSRNPILRGDSFSFYYQQRFKRSVHVKSVEMSLIYREKVSYSEGKKIRTAHHDRLAQKFTREARSYQTDESLNEEQIFQIPDREMAIHNLHMQLPDAKVTETSWLIQVSVDTGNFVIYKSEYPLRSDSSTLVPVLSTHSPWA